MSRRKETERRLRTEVDALWEFVRTRPTEAQVRDIVREELAAASPSEPADAKAPTLESTLADLADALVEHERKSAERRNAAYAQQIARQTETLAEQRDQIRELRDEVRTMRLNRRVSKAFLDGLNGTAAKAARAKAVPSPTQVVDLATEVRDLLRKFMDQAEVGADTCSQHRDVVLARVAEESRIALREVLEDLPSLIVERTISEPIETVSASGKFEGDVFQQGVDVAHDSPSSVTRPSEGTARQARADANAEPAGPCAEGRSA